MSLSPCLLFFPGSRPELYAKAAATGAAVQCVDLEDGVAEDAKDRARSEALDLLRSTEPPRLAVRINHPDTLEGISDLSALQTLPARATPLTILVPKCRAPEDLSALGDLRAAVGGLKIVPVIETAQGLARVEDIAATDGVAALFFGSLDLSLSLGCAHEWEPLLHARSRCVLAGRLAGIDILDAPFFDLGDGDGLREASTRARALGFTGKAAIHPAQVAVIREVFRPTEEEVEQARRIVDAAARQEHGAFTVDGIMVDRPVVEGARRLLHRAAATTPAVDAPSGDRAPGSPGRTGT